MELGEYLKEVRERADSYERTIQFMIAFDSAVRWDDRQRRYIEDSHFLPCRRLTKNIAGSNAHITPDIVIQLSSRYGIIAEVKITASSDQDFTKAYQQIVNYDSDLIGWKTKNEKIDLHDLALLVNDLKKNVALKFFGDKTFQRKFNLVACARISESKEFCKIEKYHGAFSDTRIESKLRDPVAIPLEAIIGDVSGVKFYDVEPPVEYTMNVIWMNALNEIKQKGGSEKGKMILVECSELTGMLQERYSFCQLDSRQPKIPREAWVREALDTFVAIKYAKEDPGNDDRYYIKYSYPRKEDMLEFFSRKNFENQNKKSLKVEQLKLEFESTRSKSPKQN